MKKIFHMICCLLGIQLLVSGCEEESPRLDAPPAKEDAAFTYAATAENDNIISFTNTAPGFMKIWDFGNGSTAKGDNVTGTFPTKGTYEVMLTVYNQGGSATAVQAIEIAETDPTLLDIPFYNFLTGGADNPEGKTWVVAKSTAGHLGVGPAEGTWPEWYSAPPNDKEGRGLYDDKMTFRLQDFAFEYEANGTIYVNAGYGADFPGAEQESGGNDFLAPYTAPDNLTWTAAEIGDGKWELKINGGHLGYYSGASPTYEVLSLSENELYVRSVQGGVPANVWYQRFVPEGFTPAEPEPEPEPLTTALPVDFETGTPPFNGFGGSTYAVIDNPDASGLNTSAKVGEYVKGTEGNWAGLETALEGMLDFSTNTLIRYKVYSPVAGRALFKLESVDQTAEPVEVFADITKTNEWQELTFDFSGTPSGTYNKVALFLDFDNNNGGTFYFDDIRQAAEMAVLTEEALTGGASKAWVLKPAAGSFGVGPARGSDAWFPNGGDLSADRPCLFNDAFIFKTGGEYEYDSKGDIYGEPYLGTGEGCTDESNLGADAKAWGSGTHSFTLTPATETDPAYITVTGTGAFIALPKAYNGGEYAEGGPPATDGSVTYEVLGYIKNGTSETLSLAIDVSGDGTVFWNFVLVAQ